MSLRIRQIVFAARDLDATVEQFARVLRLQVCYRDPEVARFGLENALLPIGDQFLEVVAPTREDTAAGRHIARHGDSAYMLIFQTDEIEADRARFQRLGVREIWRADLPEVRASQIHPKDIGAAIVSVDEPTPPESWRWAGANWHQYRSHAGAQSVLASTIGATDPVAMARRWAEVLGVEVMEEHAGWRAPIRGGALHFAPAQADLIIEHRLAVPDVPGALAEARRHNLEVSQAPAVTICNTRLHLTQA